MKWGALALALAVLAFTAGALVLTMRNSGTSADRMIPSTRTSPLDPVERALGAKPRCQSDDADDSSRCDDQAGDEKDSGGGDNEPDDKDSGD